MSYTFNLAGSGDAKDIALIRDEIDDVSSSADEDGGTEGTDYFLTDERILARLSSATDEMPLDATDQELRLVACASILDTLATNQAYVQKKQTTQDESTDGPAVADSIRAHAKSLRSRANLSLAERRNTAANDAAEPSRSHSARIKPRW